MTGALPKIHDKVIKLWTECQQTKHLLLGAEAEVRVRQRLFIHLGQQLMKQTMVRASAGRRRLNSRSIEGEMIVLQAIHKSTRH